MVQDGHEQYICKEIGRILGATVTQHDDGSQDGMYDATITYPDGRQGALEVSRVANPSQFQLANFAQQPLKVNSPHDWVLTYANTLTIAELRRWVPELVKLCDDAGLEHPPAITSLTMPDALAWYHGHKLWLSRVAPKLDGTAKVYLSGPGFGGMVSPGLSALGDWLVDQTGEDWFTSNTAKLVRSGLPELHLAVSLHDSAVPGDVLYSFITADELTINAGMPFAPLTDLWLFVPFAPVIVHWSATNGWSINQRSGNSADAVVEHQ